MVKTRLTAEEFFALPLERGELVDGEVREERPPKPEHGRIALRIGYHLMRWLEETGRGVAGVEGGFVLRRDPDRVRSPDVWFLSHERLKEVTREGFYEGAPDLAVEVVSPGEEAEGVLAKVLDYLEAHYDEIHADMEACSQVVTNTEEGRRKRHELSRSATKSVRRHDVRVVVSFD